MATLYFKIGADYDKVIRLRDEIKKLENQLKSFGTSTPNAEIKRTEERLASSRQEFTRLATEAAKAGAVLEGDFKKKIYDASQTVNDLSEKIIAQRTVVREVQADVKRLGEAYRTALKTNPIGASGKKAEYDAARKALDEERAALFGLTQEQANARLSVKKLRDEYSLFKEESGDVKDAIGDITGQMKNWIAGIAGGIGIKEFLGQMIQVRGEFENIETSLRVLLGGDSEKLSDIMSQMKEYALISPLTTKDMASALQMMIGFGIQAEDAITYLKALGDISMGDTVHFNSLALAFSQMSAAGKLMGQDLNQMINAGFNPLQQISEKTGKSIGELKDEMSKGAISAQMVQQAFIDATSAGGKFYGMAAEGAKTINGQISMLQESVDNMFNDMGQASEGIILNSIQAITKLVENYDKVGAVIIGLVTAYGTYKAALLTSMALEQARNGTLLTTIKNTKLATAAQNLFNKTVKAHPYALIASLAIGAAAAIYSLVKRTDEVSASQKALDEVSRNYNATVKSEQAEIDRLFDALRNAKEGTNEYQKAKDDILSKYGKYLNGLNSEISTLHDVEGAYKAVTAAARESARARAIESATSKAQEIYGESYTENASKLRNALIKQVGETRSSAILAQLRKDLRDTGKVSEQVRKQIGDALTGDFSYGESKAWLTGLERNEKELKDAYKEIDDLFKETEKSTTEKSSNLLKDYNEAAKSYGNAQKRLDEINANRSKYTTKQYEDAVTKLKTAKSNFEKLGGETQTNKQRQSAAVKAENKRKKEADERKKAQEELNKSLLSLQQQNQDDEIALMQDGTQKKLAEIDNDYKKRIAEIDRQEAEFKKKNEEAGWAGLTDGLTKEQQTALQEARDNAAKEQERQTNEAYLAEAQAMHDYLKQYGTFQQQKLAIAEEYAEKIKKAQSDGERLSLTAERDSSLQQIEINAIRQNIDWGSVFGDFGTMFKDQLQPTIDQLRQIAQSDTFRQSSIEDQKTLYGLIDKLEQSNAVWDSDIFKRVSDDIKAYQQAMENYTKSVNDARKAEADYVNAQKAHDAALKTGNSIMIQAAQAAVDETRSAYMAASEQVKTFGTQVQNTTTDLNSSALQAKSMFENLADGLQGLSSGSLQGIGNGIMQLDKLFSGGELTKDAGNAIAKGFQSLLGKDSKAAKVLSEALGSSGLAGQIISAILGMLDILAQGGIGGLVSNLYDTVSNAVNGILEDVLSGGIITKPLNSVVQGAKNILNTITFGGLNSWLGGNDKAVMETVNRLTESNEYLRESIDRLRERISDSGATNEQSVEYYNQAREAEEEWEENQRGIIKNLASAWTNWGYGFLGLSGKKSFNSHAPGSSWSGWDAFTETLRNNGINITIDEVGDLWNLTPEQMALLRDNNPKEWQKLFSGDGHKNPLDKVEEYIDRAGTLEELTNALNEKLTGYSWDSFLDQYKSLIKDMKDDISNFGDFINETISNALIEAFVNEKLQDDIKDLYEYIANAAPDGLSEDEIDEIRRQNEAIANQAAAWRESMVEAGLITENTDKTQQSASSKGFETMSQDTGDALNGRMTAIYEAELNIANTTTEQLAMLKAIYGQMGGNIADVASESRQILSTSYIQQNNISFPTAQLDALVDKVDRLDAKVADLVSFGADNRLSMQGVDTYIENSTKNNSQSLSLLTDIKRNTQAL